jgi:hypothetical protein
VLLECISKRAPKYDAIFGDCYWYAGTVCDCVSREYPCIERRNFLYLATTKHASMWNFQWIRSLSRPIRIRSQLHCNMASVLYPPTSHMCSRTQMVTYNESIMTMCQESCRSHIKDSVKHMYLETIGTKQTVLPLGPLFVLPSSRLDLIQHERLFAGIRCRLRRPRPQHTN